MGSASSKAARTAGASARKYPTRSPPNATTRTPAASAPPPQAARTTPAPGPSVHPPVEASEVKTESIDADAKDPALASRLSTLGAVQPNPHYSPTSRSQFDPQPQRPSGQASALLGDMMQAPPQSAFPDPRNNPVLRVLEARQRIQDEAEEDLSHVGRRGFSGRKYVDAGLIQLAMMRQARGEPSQRIEEALGIKRGRLSLLRNGTVGPMQEEDA